MSLYDPRIESVHVMRDVNTESAILTSPYFERLRGNPNVSFVVPHVSLLTKNEVLAIADKYPKDHPADLLIEALGELMLPVEQSGYVSGAHVYGGNKFGPKKHYFIASPFEYEGAKKLNEESAQILGKFGLERTLERQKGDVYHPHVSILKVFSRYNYANRKARETGVALRFPKSVEMFHPVVLRSDVTRKRRQPRRLLFERLAIPH